MTTEIVRERVDGLTAPTFAQGFLPVDQNSGECVAARDRVYAEIERLGLTRNLIELDRDGFTVLAPEQVSSSAFIAALNEELLRMAETRSGRGVDAENGGSHTGLFTPFGSVQVVAGGMLFESQLYEQALMNETVLALITYLLGESCVLSHMTSFVKGPGKAYMPLHADQNVLGAPPPWPMFAQSANATWALTDYSEENGSTAFVRGSHKLCRPPTYQEATDLDLFEPIECPAGSVILWGANTWHGAVPRRTPGVRVSLIYYYARWYHRQHEAVGPQVTPAMLERNSERFGVLTGARPRHIDPSSPLNVEHAVRYSLFA